MLYLQIIELFLESAEENMRLVSCCRVVQKAHFQDKLFRFSETGGFVETFAAFVLNRRCFDLKQNKTHEKFSLQKLPRPTDREREREREREIEGEEKNC